MEEYYQKVIKLQELLRKSEEERLNLEMKFNQTVQLMRHEEETHIKKLRSKYRKFMDDDRKRQQRNDKILETLERIEMRTSMWKSKTEKFKEIRKKYQDYFEKHPEVFSNQDSQYGDEKRGVAFSENRSSNPARQDFPKVLDNSSQLSKYSNLGNINSSYCNKLPKTKLEDSTVKTTKDYANALRQRSDEPSFPLTPSEDLYNSYSSYFKLPKDEKPSYDYPTWKDYANTSLDDDNILNSIKTNEVLPKSTHLTGLEECEVAVTSNNFDNHDISNRLPEFDNVTRRSSSDFTEKLDESEKFCKVGESSKMEPIFQNKKSDDSAADTFVSQENSQVEVFSPDDKPANQPEKLVKNFNKEEFNKKEDDTENILLHNEKEKEVIKEDDQSLSSKKSVQEQLPIEYEKENDRSLPNIENNETLQNAVDKNVVLNQISQNQIHQESIDNSQDNFKNSDDKIHDQNNEELIINDQPNTVTEVYPDTNEQISHQENVPEQSEAVPVENYQEFQTVVTTEQIGGEVQSEAISAEYDGQVPIDQQQVYQQEYADYESAAGQYNPESVEAQNYPQYDENGQLINAEAYQGYDQNGQYVGEDGQMYQQQYDENGQLVMGQGYQEYDENGQYVGQQQQLYENDQAYNQQQYEQNAGEYFNQEEYQQQQQQQNEPNSGINTEEYQQQQNEPNSEINAGLEGTELTEDQLVADASGAVQQANVLDMLETDTSESVPQESKVSNDSDFDVVNT